MKEFNGKKVPEIKSVCNLFDCQKGEPRCSVCLFMKDKNGEIAMYNFRTYLE